MPIYRWFYDFPINTSIYNGFSMAMLNNQMVSIVHGGLQTNIVEAFTIYYHVVLPINHIHNW